jgi:hypothetical protein
VADNSGIVKLALIGGAGYIAYTQGWLSFLGLSPGGSTVTASAPATSASTVPAPIPPSSPAASPSPPASTPPVPPTPVTNSLDTLYQNMVAAANAAGQPSQLGVDGWDYYLNSVLPAGQVAPDPAPLFTAAFGGLWTRSTPMVASNYWAVVSPVLKSQFGLSGLGIFGGLGQVSLRYR